MTATHLFDSVDNTNNSGTTTTQFHLDLIAISHRIKVLLDDKYAPHEWVLGALSANRSFALILPKIPGGWGRAALYDVYRDDVYRDSEDERYNISSIEGVCARGGVILSIVYFYDTRAEDALTQANGGGMREHIRQRAGELSLSRNENKTEEKVRLLH